MTAVTHAFVNPKSDGPDTTIVRPSDWNADHTVNWGEDADITTQAFGDAASAGTTGEVADAGHKHGMPALGTSAANIGTSAGGSATTPSRSDHVHATGAGTPSTQAFGDSATTGSGPAAAMTDHKHAMPANPITRAAGTSVAAGDYQTWLVLSSNSGDITGTGLTTVMTITGVGSGRYYFMCQLIYQTTATGTGIGLAVNHTGTTTQFIAEKRTSTTATTTATNAPTMAGVTAAGNMHEGQASRNKNTLIGAVSVSVDASDTDMLIHLEGFMVVSVSGDLEIKLQAESAGLVCRAMQGSFLELKKLS